MRVGLAGWILGFGPSGVGRRLEALAEAGVLGGAEILLFTPPGGSPFPPVPGVETVPVPIPHTPTWKRSFLEARLLPGLARRHGLDLLHIPTAPVPSLSVPAVTSIHGLQDFTPWARPGRRLPAPFLWRWGLRKARLLLAVSNFVLSEIKNRLPGLEKKTRVVPTGIPERFFREGPQGPPPFGLAPGYILHLGRPLPHKNLDLLLSAYRILLSRGSGTPPLVLAGVSPRGEGEVLENRISGMGLEGKALWVGPVQGEALLRLLAGAGLAVFPSLYEGQGIAPLEALAAGTPVTASDIPAHREFLGGTVPLFDPLDAEALAELIPGLLGDRKGAEKGRERARAMDTRAMAGPLLEAWREAAGRE